MASPPWIAPRAASAQWLRRVHREASRRGAGAAIAFPCSIASCLSRSRTTRRAGTKFLRHPPFPWSPARQKNPVQIENLDCLRRNPRRADIRGTQGASTAIRCARPLRCQYKDTASTYSAAPCICGEWPHAPGRAPTAPGPLYPSRCDRDKWDSTLRPRTSASTGQPLVNPQSLRCHRQ